MVARPALRPLLASCLIAAAFVLALTLRLRQAPAPLSYDEFASLYFSSHRFGELWGWWMLRETNPPLFYSILKLWRMALPEGQPMLRLLPLLISFAQIALVARLAGKAYGPYAATLAILLFALSPSDIFLSEDVRAYVLAKLAVTISFAGLLDALGEGRQRRGLALYVGGAVIAIYSHTTMLLWPPIATLAVLAEAALQRDVGHTRLARLMVANLAIAVLSAWVIVVTAIQLHAHATDIAWIEPLSLADYGSSLNLQLLMEGGAISAIMAVLGAAGLLRTWRNRVTRLSALVAVIAVAGFKAADAVHPIVSDYTLHWCATFTVLLASAALADGRAVAHHAWLWARRIAVAGVLLAVTADGLYELLETSYIPEPQDFHYTLQTVARTPRAALLASHESMGVVLSQACQFEFHAPGCPFPLVVMANPSHSDSWAFGGYNGPIVPQRHVRAALGPATTVFVFSRYVYTPLAQIGIDEGRFQHVEWDDGELIGPVPVKAFDAGR